jgi:GntR family transcriptional regulator, transcriptional repressor for pyruvate dehydrogenase complex
MEPQPARRPQKIARRLEEAILRNEFAAKERLPTERALAKRWSVSRSTVREALSLLVAKGLLTRRQGDGTYINDNANRLNIAVWSDMAQHHPDLQANLIEFRHMLERRTAELAATRHDVKDRKRLEITAKAVDEAFCTEDPRLQIEADFAFHRTIAEAAHNPLFAYLMASLQTLLWDNMQLTQAGIATDLNHLKTVRTQHAAMARSILKRDAPGAALAAAVHLDYVREINNIAPEG